MEFNCDERGDCSYDYRNVGNLGGGFGEEDDFLNRMSFSGYDTVNCVGNVNGNDSLFNDFLGFGEITGNSLPDDPFCMNVRSTLNKISDWFYENQIDLLVSDSYDVQIGGGVVDHTMLQQQISSFKMNDFEGLGDEEVSFPEDPFCMKGLVDEQIGVVDQMLFESLIGSSIQSATGVVYNITGGKDITLQEVNRVSQVVTSLADPSANIIFGAVVDDRYTGEIHVTIIATGFSQSFQKTLLTDPRAAKLLDKMGSSGQQENKGMSLPHQKQSPATISTKSSSPRRLFF